MEDLSRKSISEQEEYLNRLLELYKLVKSKPGLYISNEDIIKE